MQGNKQKQLMRTKRHRNRNDRRGYSMSDFNTKIRQALNRGVIATRQPGSDEEVAKAKAERDAAQAVLDQAERRLNELSGRSQDPDQDMNRAIRRASGRGVEES